MNNLILLIFLLLIIVIFKQINCSSFDPEQLVNKDKYYDHEQKAKNNSSLVPAEQVPIHKVFGGIHKLGAPNGYYQFAATPNNSDVQIGADGSKCLFYLNNNPPVKFTTDGKNVNLSLKLGNGCYDAGRTLSKPATWQPGGFFSMEYESGHHLSITFNDVGNNQYNAVVVLKPPGSGVISKTSQHVFATFTSA